MVAAVFLHMLRVYFTGAYKEPRELNWLIGIVLISLTMVFGYTGYLLPWDQLAFWAGQIGVVDPAGRRVGRTTPLRWLLTEPGNATTNVHPARVSVAVRGDHADRDPHRYRLGAGHRGTTLT